MGEHRPKLSDDALLAAVCVGGGSADATTVQHVLAKGLNQAPDLEYIDERLVRLHRAGLVSLVHSHGDKGPQVRLTHRGLFRLDALGHTPVSPPTD
jgi:hypothetical protein